MMLYYSKTRKIKYFLDPTKKAQGYELSRYVYTHKCFSIRTPLLDMGCGTYIVGNSHYGDSQEQNLSNSTFEKLCIYVR